MRTLQRTLACLAAMWVSMCVVSCGRGDGGEGRTTVVEFWTLSLRPTFDGYMRSRIDAFEEANPDIEILWVDVPFNAVERKLLAAAAAGRSPDVVNLSDMQFARYAGLGAFADLGEHLPSETLAAYHDGAASVMRIDGRQLGVPWYLTSQTLMANAELLGSGGLTPESVPRTWEGLLGAAHGFRERSGAYLFSQPIGTDSQLLMMMMADGIVPFAVDGSGELAAALDDARVAAFLGGWVEAYERGDLPREAATRGFEHLIDVYQDGRVAAVNTGANFLRRIRDTNRPLYETTVASAPLTGALGAPHIAVMTVCVSAQSDDLEWAARWAAFITSAASQAEFCKRASILPSTIASLDDPFFAGPTADELSDGLETIGRARAIVAEALTRAEAFTPSLEAWPDLRRSFEDAIKRALLDGEPLESALARANERWDEILRDANARRVAAGGRAAGIEAIPAVLRGAVRSEVAP